MTRDDHGHPINRTLVIPVWAIVIVVLIAAPVVLWFAFVEFATVSFERMISAKTTDIADYPAAVGAWRADYPQLVAHMPLAVPAGATKVKFEYAVEGLQAPDHIVLYFVVTPAQVQASLAALIPAATAAPGQCNAEIQQYLKQFQSPSAKGALPGQSVIVFDTALDFSNGYNTGWVWGNPATGELLYFAEWD